MASAITIAAPLLQAALVEETQPLSHHASLTLVVTLPDASTEAHAVWAVVPPG